MSDVLAKVRFPKGTRVRLTNLGMRLFYKQHHFSRTSTGVVVGHSPRHPFSCISVVLDGRTSRALYPTSFWEPIPAEVPRAED